MDNRNRARRRLTILVVAGVLLFAIWQLALRTPFVKIPVPTGADRVELTSIVTDRVAARVSKEQTVRLPSGTYGAVYYKGEQALGAEMVQVSKGLRQTLRLAPGGQATGQLSTILHQRTDKLTPLAGGYLYINKQTRAIEYAAPGSIQNVSALFDIANAPSLDFSTLSTAINIEPGRSGEVIVTTTSSVFVAKDLANIIRLPAYDKDFLNFTSSSFDAVTNRVFLLSAYSKDIYYYNLGQPESGPKVFYSNKLELNRVVAGGGSLIAYFDDLPSLGAAEVKAYGLTRQLAPVVFNADEGEPVRTLDQYAGATYISISGSGKLMAVKKKFATSMTVSNLTGGDAHPVLAPDANGVAWQNDDLYIARDKALWLFKPNENEQKLQLVASTGEPICQVIASTAGVYVSSTGDFTSKVVPGSAALADQIAEKLKKLNLNTSDYYTSFLNADNKITVVVQTKGTFVRGMEEAELQASQAVQFQKAREALGAYASDPAVTITQQDGSIVNRYIYAGVPNDGG